jgi:hypothetical protein
MPALDTNAQILELLQRFVAQLEQKGLLVQESTFKFAVVVLLALIPFAYVVGRDQWKDLKEREGQEATIGVIKEVGPDRLRYRATGRATMRHAPNRRAAVLCRLSPGREVLQRAAWQVALRRR